jgi:ribonuclease P/MRP protein subunit POP1
VTLIWKCVVEPDKPAKSKKRKGKAKASAAPKQHGVWIICHPTIFNQTFASVQQAASLAVEEAKKSSNAEIEVEIADISSQLNMFEIMGPKSSQVIKGALDPISSDREGFDKFWSSLASLQKTGSLPRGIVIGCTVRDPRLEYVHG